jgi:sulfate/thiosulfate-binding protein
MRSRAGFLLLSIAGVVLVLGSCKGSSSSSTGGSAGGVQLTLAGNSVARNVYERGLVPAFKAEYAKAHGGQTVDFVESYDGSGAQTRAILSGLKADVAALSLGPEVDKLAAAGLVKNWEDRAKEPNAGVPATSVVVMVVRQGNPKKIMDWGDLTRQDVHVVLPNPDTSGAAQWNVTAFYAWSTLLSSESAGMGRLRQVRARVKAFGKSGKEAMQIFSSGVGDVLVGWECEALDRKAAGDPVEVVYPSTTLQMEPPVAAVNPKGGQPKPAAEEFVAFLDTPEAQRIFAENHYRPRDPSVAKAFEIDLPRVSNLLTIDKLGGWPYVQKKLFGPEGLWAKAGE